MSKQYAEDLLDDNFLDDMSDGNSVSSMPAFDDAEHDEQPGEFIDIDAFNKKHDLTLDETLTSLMETGHIALLRALDSEHGQLFDATEDFLLVGDLKAKHSDPKFAHLLATALVSLQELCKNGVLSRIQLARQTKTMIQVLMYLGMLSCRVDFTLHYDWQLDLGDTRNAVMDIVCHELLEHSEGAQVLFSATHGPPLLLHINKNMADETVLVNFLELQEQAVLGPFLRMDRKPEELTAQYAELLVLTLEQDAGDDSKKRDTINAACASAITHYPWFVSEVGRTRFNDIFEKMSYNLADHFSINACYIDCHFCVSPPY